MDKEDEAETTSQEDSRDTKVSYWKLCEGILENIDHDNSTALIRTPKGMVEAVSLNLVVDKASGVTGGLKQPSGFDTQAWALTTPEEEKA